jgi:hypothetical protein
MADPNGAQIESSQLETWGKTTSSGRKVPVSLTGVLEHLFGSPDGAYPITVTRTCERRCSTVREQRGLQYIQKDQCERAVTRRTPTQASGSRCRDRVHLFMRRLVETAHIPSRIRISVVRYHRCDAKWPKSAVNDETSRNNSRRRLAGTSAQARSFQRGRPNIGSLCTIPPRSAA